MSTIGVNDIHSRLNQTSVREVVAPSSAAEVRRAIRRVRIYGGRAAIAGGRHAMGGQQFLTSGALIDTRNLKDVMSLDGKRGVVEVGAGVLWSDLIPKLRRIQGSRQNRWSIVQKQTGADRMSIGGALAANGHGRGLTLKPIVQDVESFVLVDSNGKIRECSRTTNPELFALAIGGYGLFGVITSVTLRLQPAGRLERVVEVFDVENLPAAFEQRIEDGYVYGDFQYMTDENSDDFMRAGVFSCYRRTDDPIADTEPARSTLSADDWKRLIHLGHVDKAAAFNAYADFYMGTSGQTYDIDEFQLSVYLDGYHVELDRMMGSASAGSEMITELYVPLAELPAFMAKASDTLRRENANVIYGTIRLIEEDDMTYLRWANQRYACIVFNLHVDHTEEGIAQAADAFRGLIDDANSFSGSFFLTYHRWATDEQVKRAYPQFGEFLALKQKHDPDGVFASDWYEHYRHIA